MFQHREFTKTAQIWTTGVRSITNDAQYVWSSTIRKLTSSISAYKDLSMVIKSKAYKEHRKFRGGRYVGKLYWNYQEPKRKGDNDVVVASISKYGVSLKLRNAGEKNCVLCQYPCELNNPWIWFFFGVLQAYNQVTDFVVYFYRKKHILLLTNCTWKCF